MKASQGPDLSLEIAAARQFQTRHVAGLDEAGRGALAGPVVAAAVILPLADPRLAAALAGVNDSKQLTARARTRLFQVINAHAVAIAVAVEPAATIDTMGILPATRRAMAAAVAGLAVAPGFLLIDGRIRLSTLPTPQQAVVRGDGRCLSIAAASILAKVTRDRLMIALDADYPAYGFARHKGYGTPFHLAALSRQGPCPIHRFSFAPLRRPLL